MSPIEAPVSETVASPKKVLTEITEWYDRNDNARPRPPNGLLLIFTVYLVSWTIIIAILHFDTFIIICSRRYIYKALILSILQNYPAIVTALQRDT